MKDEIKEILDKFDKVLENYELDKKFGQMSVDSICHLFPNEITIIKDCIINLQEKNKKLKELCDKYEEEHSTAFKLWTMKIEEMPDYEEKMDYKSRNEKANEYIKEHTNDFVEYLDVYETKELSNLLEGK